MIQIQSVHAGLPFNVFGEADKRNPKIVTCITYGYEPSIIQDKDILTLKNIVSLGKGVNVDCCLAVGQPVRIIKGPFKGYEGIL